MVGLDGVVQTVSRRLIRPEPATIPEPGVIHLTPWDLRMVTVDYIQKGILLPKPQKSGANLIDDLASSFARTLGCFYPLAGRLTATNIDDGTSFFISLCCNSEGAEFIHAVAPGVTVSDIITPMYFIPSVVWSFFPLNGVLGVDAVLNSCPVLAAQVTELDDGVFIGMSLNHGVADGTTFWQFFNTWSEINRAGGEAEGYVITTPPPELDRWFVDTDSVPIPLPFGKVEDIIRRPKYRPVQECFFHFSGESIKKLKAKVNAEIAETGMTSITISSLQSLLAHLWRGACRARRHSPDQVTTYILLVGCRARVKGIPQFYMGNAVTNAITRSAAGDVLDKGLGWTATLLNRAVASFDEARVRNDLASWHKKPSFFYLEALEEDEITTIGTGSSPRFNVYGNDFGWGPPVAVRSGAGNKLDGKVTVYEGRGGGGSVGMEVCLPSEVLTRLVADDEFMEAVSIA